jgi:hypothetical protein
MRIETALLCAAFALCACKRSVEQQVPTNTGQSSSIAVNEAENPIPRPAERPNARTSLSEPQGPIDPKSTEAAGQVVQSYGALIEQGRFAEAEKLWGDAGSARSFVAQLKDYPELHLEIGDLGQPEGAAGSIYVMMPVVFYGERSSGAAFRRKADVNLRRVNDVPGSTEGQRRWHIERIDWGAASPPR